MKNKQTIKEWLIELYGKDDIKINDIVNNGCISGCVPDLIYYDDTVNFHETFENEIWDALAEDSAEMECSIVELIASLNGQKNVGSIYQLKNLLVWYAVERAAQEILNDREEF